MCYARLVMVFYYVHKSKKESQWVKIDERLDILHHSSPEFQKMYAVFFLFSPHCDLVPAHTDLTFPLVEGMPSLS
jgi:hypothetical protein